MPIVLDPLAQWAMTWQVLAANAMPRPALQTVQRSRLQALLTMAQRQSRFYQERLRGLSLDRSNLSGVASVTRAELMHRFDDWVTDPELHLPDLQSMAADPTRVGESVLGRYVMWESSGSTGVPGIYVQDARSMALYDVLEYFRHGALPRLGVDERIALVGATDGHFASIVSLQRQRQLNAWLARRCRAFSILQPAHTLIDQLNAFAPTVIATYPTAAAMLASEFQNGRLTVRPRQLWTGGETLSPTVRRHVQQTWCPVIRNSYGASEFLPIASECAQGEMHLNADWVLLEPVDALGRPTPPGDMSHTVLLTNLVNQVQPLIRYDLGDQVRIKTQTCACGSALPCIEVKGRDDPTLQVQGGNGQAVHLLPLAVISVMEDQAGVFDFQLRQIGPRTLSLRLGWQGAEAQACMRHCCQLLRAYARAQGAGALRIVAELQLPVRHGRSGKVHRIVGLDAQAAESV